MTNYYVRKDGNDTTGDGSTGTPWLTLAKALTTVGIAGGHTVYIGAGTYTENMSYTNSVYINRAFTNPVTLRSESGNRDDVIISGGAVYTVFYEDGGKNVFWQDVTIKSVGSGQGTVKFYGACAAAGFTNCLIYSSDANGAIQAASAKSVTVSLTNCTLERRPDLSGDTRGVYVRPTGGATDTITLTNCTVSGNNYTGTYCVSGDGSSAVVVTIVGGTYTATGLFATAAYAIQVQGGTAAISNIAATRDETPTVVIGSDGASALVTTGTISGCTISSGTSHSLLIGYNATVSVSNSVMTGGDYGVLVKMNDGTTLTNCAVSGGSSSAVFFKGALNASMTNCSVSNTAAYLVTAGVGDSGQKCQNLQVEHNTLWGTGTAAIFNWAGSSGEAGGSVCDYNTYRPQGSGLFGSVYGTAGLTSMSGLRNAWLTYDVPSNDSHSRIYNYSGAINQVGRKMEFPRVGVRI